MLKQMNPRPIVFLDMDDVLVTSREYTSYQVITTFKMGDIDGWPELWAGLVLPEARDSLNTLHRQFAPHYVISSSWSKYLTQEQMVQVFRRTGLDFVADNLHEQWSTPKIDGSRVDEIESWLAKYRTPAQPVLVLDDDESGWSLAESCLERRGCVVLCEPCVGLVADKLAYAQRLLRAQQTRRAE